MATTNIVPIPDSLLETGDSFDCLITAIGATEIVLAVSDGVTSSTIWTLTGGIQAGYAGSVSTVSDITTLVNVERPAGWWDSPLIFTVTETIGGVPTDQSWTYYLRSMSDYPAGKKPYNEKFASGISVTEDGVVVELDVNQFDFDDTSFNVTKPSEGEVRIVALGGGVAGLASYGSWLYDTTTVGAGIASGDVRFNHVTILSATEFYIHKTNSQGIALGAVLDEIEGWRVSFAKGDGTIFVVSGQIGTRTDNSTYYTFPVANFIGDPTITNNDELVISPLPSAAFSSGDVVGPASAFTDASASFADTTGKLLKSVRNNFTSPALSPGANDDASNGYEEGSVWIQVTGETWVCTFPGTGAAIWREINGNVNSDNTLVAGDLVVGVGASKFVETTTSASIVGGILVADGVTGTSGVSSGTTFVAIDGANPTLVMAEATAPINPSGVAGQGQYWVNNVSPTRPYFTDSSGADFDLTSGAGSTLDAAITGGTPDNDVIIPTGDPVIFRDGASVITPLTVIKTAASGTSGVEVETLNAGDPGVLVTSTDDATASMYLSTHGVFGAAVVEPGTGYTVGVIQGSSASKMREFTIKGGTNIGAGDGGDLRLYHGSSTGGTAGVIEIGFGSGPSKFTITDSAGATGTIGQALTADGAGDSTWEAAASGHGTAASIDDHSDVDITTAAVTEGEVLVWRTSEFVPEPQTVGTLDATITGGTPDNDLVVPTGDPVIFRDGGTGGTTPLTIIKTATGVEAMVITTPFATSEAIKADNTNDAFTTLLRADGLAFLEGGAVELGYSIVVGGKNDAAKADKILIEAGTNVGAGDGGDILIDSGAGTGAGVDGDILIGSLAQTDSISLATTGITTTSVGPLAALEGLAVTGAITVTSTVDGVDVGVDVPLNTTHRGLIADNPHGVSHGNILSGTLTELKQKISGEIISEDTSELSNATAFPLEASPAATDLYVMERASDGAKRAVQHQNIGGAGGGHVIEEDTAPLAQRAALNFVGPDITATDNAGTDASDIAVPRFSTSGVEGGTVIGSNGATASVFLNATGVWSTPAGSGDVSFGTGTVVDNQITRFHLTTGTVIQGGTAQPSIDDSGNIVMSGVTTVDGVDVSAHAADASIHREVREDITANRGAASGFSGEYFYSTDDHTFQRSDGTAWQDLGVAADDDTLEITTDLHIKAGGVKLAAIEGTPTALFHVRSNAGNTALEFVAAAGGGDVSATGTPLVTEFARWTDATTIEGRTPTEVISDLGIDADITTLTIGASADVSNSNTGDQTITLTGDVTGTGTGSFAATIAADAVTYAKIQNVVADNVVLGNIGGAGGIVDELTGTEVTALLVEFAKDSSTQGVVPASAGGTVDFLRADGSWATPAGGGDVSFLSGTVVDNQIVRYNLTTGTSIQGGTNMPSIDDSGNIVMVGAATVDGVDVSAIVSNIDHTGDVVTTGAAAVIQPGVVDLAMMNTGTPGGVIGYAVTTGAATDIGAGTSGQVLTSNVAGTPTWEDAAGGAGSLDTVITGGTPDNDVTIVTGNPLIFRDGGVDFTPLSIVSTFSNPSNAAFSITTGQDFHPAIIIDETTTGVGLRLDPNQVRFTPASDDSLQTFELNSGSKNAAAKGDALEIAGGGNIGAGNGGDLILRGGAGTTVGGDLLIGTDNASTETILIGATGTTFTITDSAGSTGGAGEVLEADGAGDSTWGTAGTGDVTAGANLGNDLLIRGDGAVKGVQNTGISISDTDSITGVDDLTLGGDLIVTGSVDGIADLNTDVTANTAKLTADATNVAAAGAIMDSELAGTYAGIMHRTGSAAYEALKSNLGATVDPVGATDDVTLDYAVGSRWINVTLDKEFICLDATDGAAVWTETTGAGGGNDVTIAGGLNYLSIDGAPQVITLAAVDLTTDVTGLLPGANIADEAITLARMQHIPTLNVLGRVTGGTGDVEDLTATQLTTIPNVFSATLKGLVPVATGGASTDYLSADGTFSVPPGGASQLTDLSDVTAKTGSGTLVVMQTSPTIITPTIASFASATHDHADAAGGGQLTSTGLADEAVTLPKMAHIATDTFLGRITAATGDVEVLTNANAKTMLDLTGTNSGDAHTYSVHTDTIGSADFADNTIVPARLTTQADSGTLIFNASGVPAYLGPGTANDVLTSGGTGVIPSWTAPTGGAATDLATSGADVAIDSTVPAGADYVLKTTSATVATWQLAAGGGDVSATGTPLITEFARWTNGTTIEGRTPGETRDDLSVSVVNEDTAALRDTNFPAASHSGEYFFSTDTFIYQRSNGTTYDDVGVDVDDVTLEVTTDLHIKALGVGTAQLAALGVTYAKIQNVVADDVFLGRISGAGGVIEELTGTQAASLIDNATEALKGVVELSTSAETTAGLAVQASDTRLSDDRAADEVSTSGTNVTISTTAPGGADEHLVTTSATAAAWKAIPTLTRSVTLEDPTAAENFSMFFTTVAITVTQITAVIQGATSVSFDVEHGTSRAAATGTGVIGTDDVADSTTTGNITTTFTDATIPADSFVWLSTSALNGTPTELMVTIEFTED